MRRRRFESDPVLCGQMFGVRCEIADGRSRKSRSYICYPRSHISRRDWPFTFFDKLTDKPSAHGVAAAGTDWPAGQLVRLAMADVRVRLPLGAHVLGVWESLAIP